MQSFLLSWNPDKSAQRDFTGELNLFLAREVVSTNWSVSNSNKPNIGDRFYIIKLGSKGRGIFGAGKITSQPEEKPHYNLEKAKKGKTLKFCNIECDMLIDGAKSQLINMDELQEISSFTNTSQSWMPENSGVLINVLAAGALEKLWNQRTETLQPILESEYFKVIDELDIRIEIARRNEQSYLRQGMFGANKYGTCSICKEFIPIELLVCAHIKKRAICSIVEKSDFSNIVAPMWRFGCDKLYERGLIAVKAGKVVDLSIGIKSEKVLKYIEPITGNKVNKYSEGSEYYFNWHYMQNTSNA
jgi:hypothetical protein